MSAEIAVRPVGPADSSAEACPRCGFPGLWVRTRYFKNEAADVWECRCPKCVSFGLLWHVSRPLNAEEQHQIRLRVLTAESAVLKARQVLAEAEVELAVARRIAAELPAND